MRLRTHLGYVSYLTDPNSQSWQRTAWSWLLTFVGIIMVAGCGGDSKGPQREAISGSVTREGIPVDDGTVLFSPTGGGPGASTAIVNGKYKFSKENGPVAGKQKVVIVQFAPREQVPPGTPKKEANIIPETRFKKEMPPTGWTLDADVAVDHSGGLNFQVDKTP